MELWILPFSLAALVVGWVWAYHISPGIGAQYKRMKQDINRSWESRKVEKKEDAARRERIAQAELRTEELRAKRLGHE